MTILSIGKKIIILNFGLFIFAVGIVLTIQSHLGAAPWDVLHLGINNYVNLTLGQISQITGFSIVFLSIFLGEIPGIATFLNSYLIGIFIDFLMGHIPVVSSLGLQLLMLVGGIYLIGWATYFYLSVGLGSGPRDSLMMGLIKKTKLPVWKIRLFLESTVLIIGYLMGGLVGMGTIIIAGSLGFSIQHAFRIMQKNPSDIKHRTLVDEYKYLKKAIPKNVIRKNLN